MAIAGVTVYPKSRAERLMKPYMEGMHDCLLQAMEAWGKARRAANSFSGASKHSYIGDVFIDRAQTWMLSHPGLRLRTHHGRNLIVVEGQALLQLKSVDATGRITYYETSMANDFQGQRPIADLEELAPLPRLTYAYGLSDAGLLSEAWFGFFVGKKNVWRMDSAQPPAQTEFIVDKVPPAPADGRRRRLTAPKRINVQLRLVDGGDDSEPSGR